MEPTEHKRAVARKAAEEWAAETRRPVMADTPLTAAIRYGCCDHWPKPCTYHEGMIDGLDAQASTIAALTERAEKAEADVVEWKEWGEGQMNDAVRALELLGTAEARVAELEAAAKWNVYVAFADCHPDFPAFKEGWDRVPGDKAWRASDD